MCTLVMYVRLQIMSKFFNNFEENGKLPFISHTHRASVECKQQTKVLKNEVAAFMNGCDFIHRLRNKSLSMGDMQLQTAKLNYRPTVQPKMSKSPQKFLIET